MTDEDPKGPDRPMNPGRTPPPQYAHEYDDTGNCTKCGLPMAQLRFSICQASAVKTG